MTAGGNYSISFLVPVFGHKSVQSAIASIATQKIPHYEILILRNGLKDLPADVKITEAAYENVSSRIITEIKIAKPGKGNALNIGLARAAYDIICVVDADCVLLPGAVDSMAQYFANDKIIAVGGCLQATDTKNSYLAQLQQFEYMRVFSVVRPIYALLEAQCLMSGAWGMFRKENLLQVGGYDHHTVGEDMELTLRLQEQCFTSGDKKLAYAKEAVCATKVPQTLVQLFRQRDRWQRGLLDSLLKHWYMLGNPRYGLLGMVVLPYQLIVELLGPALLVMYVFSSAFRNFANNYEAVYMASVFYEVAITFYAAYQGTGKDSRKSAKQMLKLLLLSLAEMALQIPLAVAKLYGMATFCWRRTKW